MERARDRERDSRDRIDPNKVAYRDEYGFAMSDDQYDSVQEFYGNLSGLHTDLEDQQGILDTSYKETVESLGDPSSNASEAFGEWQESDAISIQMIDRDGNVIPTVQDEMLTEYWDSGQNEPTSTLLDENGLPVDPDNIPTGGDDDRPISTYTETQHSWNVPDKVSRATLEALATHSFDKEEDKYNQSMIWVSDELSGKHGQDGAFDLILYDSEGNRTYDFDNAARATISNDPWGAAHHWGDRHLWENIGTAQQQVYGSLKNEFASAALGAYNESVGILQGEYDTINTELQDTRGILDTQEGDWQDYFAKGESDFNLQLEGLSNYLGA